MLAKLLCRLGRHEKSYSRMFRASNGMLTSRCRGCGERIVRDDASGQWYIPEPQPRPTPPVVQPAE